MSHKPGTPLPAALDGIIVERPIRIDRALLYLVGGALAWLTDNEPLEQTGTLTVEAARDALSAMLWDFYHEVLPVDNTPIGAIMQWPLIAAPTNWLVCDGTIYEKADYPDYAALIEGTTWDEDATHFSVPDLRDRTAIAPGTFFPTIGAMGGEREHTLNTSEMPAHTHQQRASNGTNLLVANGATSSTVGILPVAVTRNVSDPQPLVTASVGADAGHNNMQPFTVLQYIIRVL